MSYTMKLWERMIEARLRETTKIADNLYALLCDTKLYTHLHEYNKYTNNIL